jgi:queuine tRNA-ribosyltransferase
MGITWVDTEYTKAYLRHLLLPMNTWETNCYDTQSWFYMWLVREARKHILAGDFKPWKEMMVNMNQRL